jgi:hypothetical protein
MAITASRAPVASLRRRAPQMTYRCRPTNQGGAAMQSRWTLWRLTATLLITWLAAATSHAQPNTDTRDAFKACDAQAFLALNIARNYLMSDRNRALVMPHVEGSAIGQAMAEDLFQRVDSGEIRHPGQFAADTLFKCADELKLRVGASRDDAAVCFTRTDAAFFLHTQRAKGVQRQQAVSAALSTLKVRSLYPAALINQVAEAVYRPAQPPDLRQLMGTVAWGCIRAGARAGGTASAASR